MTDIMDSQAVKAAAAASAANAAQPSAHQPLRTAVVKAAELARAAEERARDKQHAKGKKTARERLDLLFDTGTFEEIGRFQGGNIAGGNAGAAVITDGDIRKFFLRGGTPDQTVDHAANYHPLSVSVSERGKARSILQEHCIDALPVLNKRGIITDIVFAHGLDLDNRKQVDIPVVMMAGGLGTRLYPYTKILPKPLIPVGEQPIAELIMDRFRDFGCHDFTMIVNYKKGMIKSYFNELEKDYTVDFADEEVFMGTGGGLCLLKGKIKAPFFFTNCDTLLDVDFGDIYEYHKSHGNLVTMICAFKHYTVPYGVVELGENGSIAAMREKPELDFLTNTGVYVVEPRVVEEMRDGEKIGFPDVIERYRRAGEKVGVYPISESSWMDMGQLEELEKMRRKLENQQ